MSENIIEMPGQKLDKHTGEQLIFYSDMYMIGTAVVNEAAAHATQQKALKQPGLRPVEAPISSIETQPQDPVRDITDLRQYIQSLHNSDSGELREAA